MSLDLKGWCCAAAFSKAPFAVQELQAEAIKSIFPDIAIAYGRKALEPARRAADPDRIELGRRRSDARSHAAATDILCPAHLFCDQLHRFVEVLDDDNLYQLAAVPAPAIIPAPPACLE